ncbi:hypothetical protein KAW65_01295 [candidate division WOR-3 bacterium]|nr:hypothetical protein [candidate division WOR-3 bacterium]
MKNLFGILVFLIGGVVFGDEIKLKDGTFIEGEIKNITENYVNIMYPDGSLISIERQKIDLSQLTQLKKSEFKSPQGITNWDLIAEAGEDLKTYSKAYSTSMGFAMIGIMTTTIGTRENNNAMIRVGYLFFGVSAIISFIAPFKIGDAGEKLKKVQKTQTQK